MKNSNYNKVLDEFEETLSKFNRNKNEVQLMAVSKTRTLKEILPVFQNGQYLFGENRVQEITAKFEDREAWGENFEKINCHLIGHLQKNKVSKAVRLVDCIESVDSIKILEAINRKCLQYNKPMDILLEVNTSKEASKSGFTNIEEFEKALELSKTLKMITIKGLMTVGPIGMGIGTDEWEKATHQSFIELRNLRDKYLKQISGNTLSMGMSQDYKIAIEEGSTLVRVGTAIFGARN